MNWKNEIISWLMFIFMVILGGGMLYIFIKEQGVVVTLIQIIALIIYEYVWRKISIKMNWSPDNNKYKVIFFSLCTLIVVIVISIVLNIYYS